VARARTAHHADPGAALGGRLQERGDERGQERLPVDAAEDRDDQHVGLGRKVAHQNLLVQGPGDRGEAGAGLGGAGAVDGDDLVAAAQGLVGDVAAGVAGGAEDGDGRHGGLLRYVFVFVFREGREGAGSRRARAAGGLAAPP
jgi:hypothetical protein